MSLTYIQIDTDEQPDCAIIWLHGLGANGHDFEPIVDQLELPDNFRGRFIFPHAPDMPVTLNNGMCMPAWFDIYSLEKVSQEDDEGIHSISKEIDFLIEQQIQSGIVAKRIILAGFSQGGALALFTGLHSNHRLAGLIALSCYLPLREQLEIYAKHADRALPILLAHGLYDEIVSHTFAQHTKELLEQQQFKVQLKEYPCAHSVCAQEIIDIRNWLVSIL